MDEAFLTLVKNVYVRSTPLFLSSLCVWRLICIWFLCTGVVSVNAQLPEALRRVYVLADSSMVQSDYSSNLEYCLEAVKIADAEKNCQWQADAYRRLGIAFDYLKNRERSLYWLYRSYDLTKTCAKSDTIHMRTARYIGAMFYGVQQGDSCIRYLNESAALMLANGFYAEAASAYGMLGEAYSTIQMEPDMAEKQYLESIRLAECSGRKQTIGYALFRYGCHLARNGDCLEGKPFIDSSYALFTSIHDMEGVRWALNGMAYAESRCGDGKAVYDHMSLIQSLNDSLFREETAKQSAHFEALFEKEKQDRAIMALEQRTRDQRIYAAGIIGAVILLSAIGWLVLNRRSLRNKQRAEQKLHALQLNNYRAVLDAENQERQRIASELHDSLGQLLSAARMHISALEQDQPIMKKTADLLDEAAREVRHISHNLMPASLSELGLVAAIRQMIRTMSPGNMPAITSDCKDYRGSSTEHEMAIYRMAQELLSNSIRHGKAKNIMIQLSSDHTGVHFALRDDGCGFDTTSMQTFEGIGLKNLHTRVDMMRGKLHIESTLGQGSFFRIYLPI